MGLFDSIRNAFGSSQKHQVIDVDTRYERMRTSAVGTMSSFYVAKDHKTDRLVGVKLLDVEKHEQFEARFKGLKKPGEAEIALSMHHPKIVETYEAGVTPKGQPVIIMEYIEGPSLQQIIVKKQRHLIAGIETTLIRDMAESLKYVHDQGYIHRDICPRNYICLPDMSGLKLIDFGLTVPATPPFMAPGNRTGTPLYMSPEIVRRRPTDKRVDIFSLGVTCYCLCTMQHPWQGEVVTGKAALQHDTTEPTPILERAPDLDPKLARLIMHALQPSVEKRVQSIDQFLATLRTIAA
ncbi:serine/threonine protein kinase [Crateriforma conspicua]|uniref:Serine/threonine-protein kinase PknB n=1 Tax=Crateriforma conspicua TaxID=2527996 RepID=A0A5C6FJI9_9PLAN|nr:serine/threonine-protein kinase [Crateriforma conspicua]TWU62425.1 Serine/threonine-protein kinase PknB [Crateriforma conspicua]